MEDLWKLCICMYEKQMVGQIIDTANLSNTCCQLNLIIVHMMSFGAINYLIFYILNCSYVIEIHFLFQIYLNKQRAHQLTSPRHAIAPSLNFLSSRVIASSGVWQLATFYWSPETRSSQLLGRHRF